MTAMSVERIHTERGSHIEPPLEQDWDNLTKLRWRLAVVLHDAGLPDDAMRVEPADYRINGVPQEAYGVIGAGGISGAIGYHSTWTFLNGVSYGLRERGQR